ncbi:MAG TPA: hypothetical protein VHD76_12610 [Bryobacteraceae bacterium]|jgi:hypothetical protein|nr:hypothetical protein [Bryobacteraceae bacterium]
MRKGISVILAVVCLVNGAWAASIPVNNGEHRESVRHQWIRRLVGAAACGLSAMDAVQSSRNIGANGIVEGNPILSNQGRLRTGRMVGLKIGACAAPLAIGEFGAARRNKFMQEIGLWTGVASAGAGAAVVVHNQRVLGQSK